MNQLFQSGDVTVVRAHTGFAQAMFDLIDRNRTRLHAVFPWVEKIKSLEDQTNFYHRAAVQWEQRTAYHFVIQVQNHCVGAVSIHTIDWNERECEFGYWIGQSFEGRKITSRALTLLEPALAQEGIRKIFIKTHDFNKASQKLACSLGFRLTQDKGDGFIRAEKTLLS